MNGSHTEYSLSAMIASNLRLRLVFLQVLAKPRASMKRLPTNWAKVLGLTCKNEKARHRSSNQVLVPMLRVLLQKLLCQVNSAAVTLGPTSQKLQTMSNTRFPLNAVLVRPWLPKEFGRLAWSSEQWSCIQVLHQIIYPSSATST